MAATGLHPNLTLVFILFFGTIVEQGVLGAHFYNRSNRCWQKMEEGFAPWAAEDHGPAPPKVKDPELEIGESGALTLSMSLCNRRVSPRCGVGRNRGGRVPGEDGQGQAQKKGTSDHFIPTLV